MDSKKVLIFQSKLNHPPKPRKAEEIIKWMYTPMFGWDKDEKKSFTTSEKF
jgi:hypothetical protein